MKPYKIALEVEWWAPDDWNVSDGNTDVFVTFADGAKWIASCFTYANIASLTQKNQRTGECLAGKYFWATDMILVDEISRERIEEIVAALMEEEKFETIFKRIEGE